MDLAGIVSGRGPELPFCDFDTKIGDDSGLVFWNLAPRAHLRCLSRKSNFVDIFGVAFEPGSDGSFAMLAK